MSRALHLMVLLTAMLVTPIGVASAQQGAGPGHKTWQERKCAFYAEAWRELLASSRETGVTEEFIRGNEAFIAAGCSNGADICSSSPADIALANKLTIAAMNFGTASTFLPFVCRQPQ
ncbi:hypothetical protein SAMN03159496_04778 [Rhizobium sp. NFR07]|uniref:hypothetical protein n=1 Tax=Rhizobium sp. NFR07 TaxID=1566262 RepID=UPI0008DFADE3|nr:hypothetical protein [Rhizobium sp. NFR07]SFB53150.1 hypothetical protein SAMN03159496_04778 [Rhizobium sp. NFR07]